MAPDSRSRCAGLIRQWLKERGVIHGGNAYSGLAKAFDRHPECPAELKDSEFYKLNRRKAIFAYLSLKQPGPIEPLPQPAPEKKKTEEPRPTFAPDSFYTTKVWKRLRYRVLIHYGRKCMCCGATVKDGVKIHVDHIKPRSRYPELALEFANLQVLCEPCNIGKSADDETDFRPPLHAVEPRPHVFATGRR